MPKTTELLRKFLIWKYKHISERQFVYILSILVGLLAGLGTVTLKNLTHYIQLLLEGNIIKDYAGFYFVFPIIGLSLVFIYQKYILKRNISHGITSALHSISRRNGIIKPFKIYAPLIAAPLTVGFGGSVGLQGPAVTVASAIGSNISQLFHINAKTRMLLIGCATAGSLAAMFKAPVAAIIFAVEIFALDLAFASLIPLLLASVSAILTSYLFLGSDSFFGFDLQDTFEIKDLIFYIILGVGTGIASIYFSKMYFYITQFFKRITNPIKKLIIGGIAIGIMLYFIPPLYGEGFDLMNDLLLGNNIRALRQTPFDADLTNIWIVIGLLIGITFFKAIAMTTTFAAGGVGGIFIPTLFMGSTIGNIVAKVINNIGLGFSVNESSFTLVGMTGLLAGVLHAPLTAIFLIAEITGGYELFLPLMIVAAISFAFTKYFVTNSIYTSELAKKGQLITHNKDSNVLMMMKIDKIIEQNFISLSPEMKLGEIVKNAVAKSSRNHFPVVNADNEFLGILRLDDIRHIMFDTELYEKITVKKLMHNAPDIIDYDNDSVPIIMKKFKYSSAWNLPVIKDGKYFGFISKSKLLTVYRRKLVEVTH
ncbi:chloride channel protein [Urechidicola vernalis]|uniref:Chloride channel protein n=1 Tax=Urechidicola vernalis TaxID=3075600 RepID=A0ABU2Y656_9FLAO|nr:chloride channel protein [Urechidicola sp. P050]MDT0553686.1 chloride channel protein [Urechidicola sp. P050]